MKTKNNRGELVHDLPDYITGRIEDSNLIAEIESEIKNNPEFKTELENISSAMNFLKTSSLESPSEVYFNNLSVKINERISRENVKESYWEKLGTIWKILIPAIPLIILAVILYNALNNKELIVSTPDKTDSKTEIAEKKNDQNNNAIGNSSLQEKENNPSLKTETSNPDNLNETEKKTINKSDNKKRNHGMIQNSVEDKQLSNTTPETENATANLVSDKTELTENENPETEFDVLYSKDSEEYNLEEEFRNLTPEQQKEIVEDLSTQINNN